MKREQKNLKHIGEVRRAYASGEARQRRLQSGITQSEFAKAIGASTALISLWESGGRKPRGEFAVEAWDVLEGMRQVEMALAQEGV